MPDQPSMTGDGVSSLAAASDRRRPDSALVFPVLELEPVLDRIAAYQPGAVRAGIPPHVSVCYPFLPRAALSAAVREEMRQELPRRPGTPVELTAPRSSPGILYSSPSPSGPITALREDLERRWPCLASARAAHEADLAPIGVHLTLALTSDDTHQALAALVGDWFPCRVTLSELWLLERNDTGWRRTEIVPLEEPRGEGDA